MITPVFTNHDHSVCIEGGIDAAEKYCERKNLRLTAVRRRVLEILLREHSALGAYDILAQLTKEGLGSQPPIVYRALNFLVDNNLAHRVERLNAYIACTQCGKSHAPELMICRVCNLVAEMSSSAVDKSLTGLAQQAGFRIERAVVEAEGICSSCIAKGAT